MQGCSIPMRLQRRLKSTGRSSRRSKQASIVESPRFWYNTARGGDMPVEESDKLLVERLKGGDAIAFGTLHRRYYAKIYRLALLKTNHPDDAADIASDTFCKALEHLPSYEFRRCDSLYPWLHRIASNAIIDRARSRPPGGEVSLDAATADEVGSFLECLPDTSPSPQELVERKEVQALVRQAIKRLPADQGEAILYRFLGDLSIKEIARALDRSEGAVKSLLHRALVSLRQGMLADALEQRSASQPTKIQPRSAERSQDHAGEMVRIRPGDGR
jgi:RNA polymerase sigma-70 factor (ECF subfamily)